jgi:hypothetical protein
MAASCAARPEKRCSTTIALMLFFDGFDLLWTPHP